MNEDLKSIRMIKNYPKSQEQIIIEWLTIASIGITREKNNQRHREITR
jgi:hypothetical protein